jgi:hypothetical protein
MHFLKLKEGHETLHYRIFQYYIIEKANIKHYAKLQHKVRGNFNVLSYKVNKSMRYTIPFEITKH